MAVYLSLYYGKHDSCASFCTEDEVLLHLEAERVFRRKHMTATAAEMEQLVAIGLEYLGLSIDKVDTLYIGRWGIENTATHALLGRTFHPVWTSHHENHIGLGRYLGWEDALCICADGGSEDGWGAVFDYDGASDTYKEVDRLEGTLLTGRFYAAVTQLVIGDDWVRAHIHWPGKTMGLSAFGRYDERMAKLLIEHGEEFNKVHRDGVAHLREIFGTAAEPSTTSWRRWNLAHTAQKVWEDQWMEQIQRYAGRSQNLIFSGGCALNVLLNRRLRTSGVFSQMFVPPTAADDGQSLGALLRHVAPRCDFPFLGRGREHMSTVPERAAEDLLAGRILFWHNGRAEAGPRSLGHRSMIGLPNTVQQRVRISEEIKRREWYRPVAPMVLEEHAAEWFEVSGPSPYMLEAVPVTDKTWHEAPAIVHIDGTSRIQTINRSQDPIMHGLLTQVHEACGIPMLMNTSMNMPGEPICDTEEDTLRTFANSKADVLYLNDKRFERGEL